MIDPHQQISEFSYGYGITREVQLDLLLKGYLVTPYLPNLKQENFLGYDVRFEVPGEILLLQFKLSKELSRFRPPPNFKKKKLTAPFWRFEVDVDSDQYNLLLGSEQVEGVTVYYVAPKFSKWEDFDYLSKSNQLWNSSITVTPSAIKRSLQRKGEFSGVHKIVYDQDTRYIFSEHEELETDTVGDVLARLEEKIGGRNQSLKDVLSEYYLKSSNLLKIKGSPQYTEGSGRQFQHQHESAVSMANALGWNAWCHGVQMFLITRR